MSRSVVSLDPILDRLEADWPRYLEELKALVRIPSISASPEHAEEVRRCAATLAARLERIGLRNVTLLPTGGPPVVYADWLDAGPDAPTLLIYGHYDVQPVDPIELWESPPFEPVERDGQLYGRGTTDDKGQLSIHVNAVDAYLQAAGRLPVNVKFLLEGEEEIGSDHLAALLHEKRERLRADAAVVSDATMWDRGIPAIGYGLRGICGVEIVVHGPAGDLHSGAFGGAVPNPNNTLAQVIAALKDQNGRVTIPGFYDRVRSLGAAERQALAELPFDEEAFRRAAGVTALVGEATFSTVERLWTRPTLDVNGLWGGFTGTGMKTVIPAHATAKITMRLVPDQDPTEITELFDRYVPALAPAGTRVEVIRQHGGRPFLTPLDHPAMGAAARALEAAFGRPPVYIREGGSIPVVADMAAILGAPVLLVGFGLNDERAHAPNERFDLGNFRLGMRSAVHLYDELARALVVHQG
ncbi:MAG: dipeptidase [Chloroflexi bacterium]|nr:dipeptidase [Chloroflexota bacterium]